MAKKSKRIIEAIERLTKGNKKLQQQLLEAKSSIDAIKSGNIDALVIANKKYLKIYTEKTADKIYRVLIEKMHEGAITINPDGIIMYCNSYFAHMVNHSLQKVIGTKFKNFISDSSMQRFEELRAEGRTRAVKEEIYIQKNGGKAIPVLISITALSFENNKILSIILTDLTILHKNQDELKSRAKQLENKNEELENANKDLTTFTYVSSHDLQEPLRKIQNFASFILSKDEQNLSGTGKDYFIRMQETAARMQALIDDLLTYSRTKTSERKFEKTDLNLIIDDAKKDYEEVIQKTKAKIEIANLCEVTVIRFQFRQLMQNLIGNSLKFTRPGIKPHIVIKSKVVKGNLLNIEKLSPKKKYCHIIFSDNGIGFDPQYKERIFEVFQRLHGYEKYKGTGIGLAICKRIVENHNGLITATGKLNKGARFDIYIPA